MAHASSEPHRHIQSIYDAAIDPEGWDRALHGIAEVIAAEAPGIALQAPLPGDPGRGVLFDLDPAFVASWPEYHLRFEAATRLYDAVPLGGVATFDRLPMRGRIRRTEFWDEWMRPQGLGDCMLSVAWREGDSKGGAGWMRRRTQGEFGAEEVAFVERLMPHFQQAVRIDRRIAGLESERAMAREIVAAFAAGVILVSPGGRVVEINTAAERILRANDGISKDREGFLRAARAEPTQRLRELIARAAATGAGNGEDAGGALVLPRPSARRPLQVLVAPVGRDSASRWSTARPAAVVFVSDPEREPALPESRVRRLLGLTRMEARVAIALARGATSNEIAERIGVQPNTVHWHLKQIYSKTGARRQAELVRLVLALPAAAFDQG